MKYTSKAIISDSKNIDKALSFIAVEVYPNSKDAELREYELNLYYTKCKSEIDIKYYDISYFFACGKEPTVRTYENSVVYLMGDITTPVKNESIEIFDKILGSVAYTQNNVKEDSEYSHLKELVKTEVDKKISSTITSIEKDKAEDASDFGKKIDLLINEETPAYLSVIDLHTKYDKMTKIGFYAPYLEEWIGKIQLADENLNRYRNVVVNNINEQISNTYSSLTDGEVTNLEKTINELGDSYFDDYKSGWKTSIHDIKVKISNKKVQDYKDSASNISYDELLRNPHDYSGETVHFFGKVVQKMGSGTSFDMRVSVSCVPYNYISDYSCPDTIYVSYSGETRIIENDYIDLWGTASGTKTYTTVLGSSVTIPYIYSKYIDLNN